MKICMIGLGSIGQRHIKNIGRVLTERKAAYTIDAMRSSRRKLPKEIEKLLDKQYFSYEELPADYDVVFITNPTSEHYTAMTRVSAKTKAMFIEKPVFSETEMNAPKLQPEGVYYVACPIRHKAVIQYVKDELGKGEEVFAVRAISSSYLPEWRKGVDYRTTYSANRALGGGVTLDLIHEWDYLTYLFGMPQKLMHLEGHYSPLEIDCEDASLYMADYGNLTIEVHLDYYGRFPERRLELYCRDYRMDVDLIKNIITYKSTEPDKNKEIVFPEEDFYLNEMNYFFDLLEGRKENINTVSNARKVLALLRKPQ
ncbi:MAG: Gfo/Idh/MocA family oxidoreductase [Bacteroidales bacterium]|nr:Gfo/Idh/MocA family oxidoreductase [Lachnoclostridium sp.]MCM1383953.1 Gfo/Idh/MocA family oxidoreductase [Lachnoclostridium sp.]MCM1464662.1 Gfo/Idh/MocA family oxidoreductase [Bacteroidales bacterium]